MHMFSINNDQAVSNNLQVPSAKPAELKSRVTVCGDAMDLDSRTEEHREAMDKQRLRPKQRMNYDELSSNDSGEFSSY